MDILSMFTGIFKKKKSIDEILKEVPKDLPNASTTGTNNFGAASESATVANVKARMDLVLTQMDSLRVQYESVNERLINIEKMLKELYDMAKSS